MGNSKLDYLQIHYFIAIKDKDIIIQAAPVHYFGENFTPAGAAMGA